MNRKTILMGSVSVVALASVASHAQAQDANFPDGYTLSIEGGLTFGPNTVAEDKIGYGPFESAGSAGVIDIQDNLGYRAAISMGKRLDPFWDLRVTGAINQQMESESSFSASAGSGDEIFGDLLTDFDYETLDFEAGYRPALDSNLDVRLFAGLRGLHYKDSIDKMGYLSSGGPDKIGYGADISEEFLGVGPRVGVEVSAPLGDSMFGITGMVAGGALFGTARTSGEYTVYSGGLGFTAPIPGEEESVTVYNLEAALGLDMHVADDMTVTVGYRAEGLFGVGSYGSSSSGGLSQDRWSHGPTLKLTGYLD